MHQEKLKELLAAHEKIKQHIRHICAVAPRLVTELLQDQNHGQRKEAGVLTVVAAGEAFCLMLGERTIVFALHMQAPAQDQRAIIRISVHRNIGIGQAVVHPLGTVEMDTKGLADCAGSSYDTTNPEHLRELLAYALLLALMN